PRPRHPHQAPSLALAARARARRARPARACRGRARPLSSRLRELRAAANDGKGPGGQGARSRSARDPRAWARRDHRGWHARGRAQGVAVWYLVDREPDSLASLARELGCGSEVLDLRDERAVRRSIEHAVQMHGGLDGVVSNAGVAPQAPIEQAQTDALQDSFA